MLCAVASTVIVVVGLVSFVSVRQDVVLHHTGLDFNLYRDAATRWLAGGGFYEPYQLAGPYQIVANEVLYPPVILWVLVPFALGLPVVLWWAVPLGLVGWSVWRLRPGPLAWPVIAACLVWPPTIIKIAFGNPVLWAWAALAVGVVYVGPAVFVLIKPSLAPFASWGVNRRRWWLCLGIFAALSLPLAGMYVDWLTVLRNSQSSEAVGGGWLYSFLEAPMMFIPVVAWAMRGRSSPAPGRWTWLPRPSARASDSRSGDTLSGSRHRT